MNKEQFELKREKDRMLDYFLDELKRQCEYSFISLKNLEYSVNDNKNGAEIIFYNTIYLLI